MRDFAVTASGPSLAVVRQRVRLWLAELEWPDEAAADIVFAVNEAATNAVEHAYPTGTARRLIEVSGAVESDLPGDGGSGSRRVRVSVRDQGRWRADVHNRSDLSRARGRGLAMMDAMMAEMVVSASATTGTTVVLVSESVAIP